MTVNKGMDRHWHVLLTKWKSCNHGPTKCHLSINLRGGNDVRYVRDVGKERGEVDGIDVSNGSMLDASSHLGARISGRISVADEIRVIERDIDVCSCPSDCGRVVGDVGSENSKRREDIWRGGGGRGRGRGGQYHVATDLRVHTF